MPVPLASLYGLMRIVAIGELLWDVIEDAEHIGGAPFNFCAHAARLGHDVMLISAVGNDARGERARVIAAKLGISTRFIRTAPRLPTGSASVQLDAERQPHFLIHRPAAYDGLHLDAADYDHLAAMRPDWICFGTLYAMQAGPREILNRVLAACPSARRFYDINLRRDSYTPELVQDLMTRANVAKLNEDEMHRVRQMLDPGPARSAEPEQFCRDYALQYGWQAVCVTRGGRGCALSVGNQYIESPAHPTEVVDAVGAGDSFAAAFIHGMGNNWPAARIATFANRVASLVASRRGAVPAWTLEECAP